MDVQAQISEGYTDHGQAILPILRDAFGLQVTIAGAEIGVSHGVLSGFLLRELPTLHLSMVDRWDLPYTKPYSDPIGQFGSVGRTQAMLNAVERTVQYADRRVVIKSDSVEAADGFPVDGLDFAFIDADHGREGCLGDIIAWWPKIRSGGLMCGDDFDCPMGKQWDWGVKQAVEEFAISQRLPYEIMAAYTWLIRKP